jgi:galactokinase
MAGPRRRVASPSQPPDPAWLRDELARREPDAAADPTAIRVVRAPGRVNLIGEHTDYNLGYVLPVAIDREIRIAILPRDTRRVELEPLQQRDEPAAFDLDAIPPASGQWIDYVAGMAWALQDAGLTVHGARGVLASNLPMSAGLSSSAALELAAAWALLATPDLAAQGLDGMGLARLAQRAENEHVGVRTGLMDQFASSLGRAGSAMLLDCRSREYRAVSLPLERHALVVCDSGSPRRLASSEYNARRAQCEAAVAAIAAEVPGVASLRDIDLDLLARFADRLEPDAVRRCEHVIRENARVLDTVAAFEAGDLAAVGRLFAESHASLRDLYEVSSPELNALVEIATAVPGVVGARMTGAGFGGCTVNLVARGSIDELEAAVERDYERLTGRRARVLRVEPADGAGLVP